MKTIEIAKASNDQLDWLVSTFVNGQPPEALTDDDRYSTSYAALWEVGGPVIDDYRIMFRSEIDGVTGEILGIRAYFAEQGLSGPTGLGDTHLQAAMRAVVVRFCGDTAEVPEDL